MPTRPSSRDPPDQARPVGRDAHDAVPEGDPGLQVPGGGDVERGPSRACGTPTPCARRRPRRGRGRRGRTRRRRRPGRRRPRRGRGVGRDPQRLRVDEAQARRRALGAPRDEHAGRGRREVAAPLRAEPGRLDLGLQAQRAGTRGRRTGGPVRVLRDLGGDRAAASRAARRTPGRPRRPGAGGIGSQPSGNGEHGRDGGGRRPPATMPTRARRRADPGPAPTSGRAARTGARPRRRGRSGPRPARAGGAHRPARPPGDPRSSSGPPAGRLGRGRPSSAVSPWRTRQRRGHREVGVARRSPRPRAGRSASGAARGRGSAPARASGSRRPRARGRTTSGPLNCSSALIRARDVPGRVVASFFCFRIADSSLPGAVPHGPPTRKGRSADGRGPRLGEAFGKSAGDGPDRCARAGKDPRRTRCARRPKDRPRIRVPDR